MIKAVTEPLNLVNLLCSVSPDTVGRHAVFACFLYSMFGTCPLLGRQLLVKASQDGTGEVRGSLPVQQSRELHTFCSQLQLVKSMKTKLIQRSCKDSRNSPGEQWQMKKKINPWFQWDRWVPVTEWSSARGTPSQTLHPGAARSVLSSQDALGGAGLQYSSACFHYVSGLSPRWMPSSGEGSRM